MLIRFQATFRLLLEKANSLQSLTSTRQLVLRSQAPYMIALIVKMKKMIKALSLVGGAYSNLLRLTTRAWTKASKQFLIKLLQKLFQISMQAMDRQTRTVAFLQRTRPE